jgi:hypothetical protein
VRLAGALFAAAALCGCVQVTFGDYPVLTDPPPRMSGANRATVATADFALDVTITGFQPDWGLIGPIVPLIPIGAWNGMIWSKEHQRVSVWLSVREVRAGAAPKIVPGSARIRFGVFEQPATEIDVASCNGCWSRVAVQDPNEPVDATLYQHLLFRFDTLPLPDRPFVLEVEGMPAISWKLERETHWGTGI